jgi:flagellar motility protein MotE (MotC chaperone)
MTPKAAQAQAASLSPVALPANAITAGAASFLNSQVAALPALAQSAGAQNSRASNPGPQTPAIPLPPGDENLRRPQTVPAPPPRPTGPTSPLPPPPNAATPQAAEEQARRSFELNRRETELSAREQAIKELEADLNARLAAAEKSKAELKDLVSRNEAILEEQKAVQEQRKVEEEALKDARVEHLVLAFKGMKPEQAGQLVNSLDDAVAVSILSAMPGSQAGKILAMVQPEKAARLIKSISESRLDPKTILEQQTNAPGQGAPGATPNPAS